jgi:hypothetical protein
VVGVRVEVDWTPVGDYQIYVAESVNDWGSPVAASPPDLTVNADHLFATGKAGAYLRLVIQMGAEGSSYCYITDFWVLASACSVCP